MEKYIQNKIKGANDLVELSEFLDAYDKPQYQAKYLLNFALKFAKLGYIGTAIKLREKYESSILITIFQIGSVRRFGSKMDISVLLLLPGSCKRNQI